MHVHFSIGTRPHLAQKGWGGGGGGGGGPTYASSLFSNLICPRHICNFIDEQSSGVLQVIPTKAFTNIIACLYQLQPYSKDAWIPCFKALQLTESDLLGHYGSCTTEIAIFWV